MNILLIASFGYIFSFLLYLICLSVINLKIRGKYLFYPMLLLALAMACIAFFFDIVDNGPDLQRHMWTYDIISGQYGELTKATTIFSKLSAGFVLWIGIFYVAIFFGSFHFVPFIVVLINYIFFAFSCRLICKQYQTKSVHILAFLVIKVGLVSWFHVFSGLRNAYAFSLLAYVVLLICIGCQRNKGKIIIVSLMATMLHTSSWIVILLIFFSQKGSQKIIYYLFLSTWSYYSFFMVKLLLLIPIYQTQYIAEKFQWYYGIGADKAVEWRIFLVSVLFLILLFFHIMMILINSRHIRSKFEKKYLDFIKIFYSFLIGSVLMPTIYMRFIYLIGYIFLPIVVLSVKYLKKRDMFLFLSGECVLGLFMCVYNWVALTSHLYLYG